MSSASSSSSNCRNKMLSATPKNSFHLKEQNGEKKNETNKHSIIIEVQPRIWWMRNCRSSICEISLFVPKARRTEHIFGLCACMCACVESYQREISFLCDGDAGILFNVWHHTCKQYAQLHMDLDFYVHFVASVIWQCAPKIVVTQRALFAFALCPVVAAMHTRPNKKFIVHSIDLHGVRDASTQFVLPINKTQINAISGSIIEAIGFASMLFSL